MYFYKLSEAFTAGVTTVKLFSRLLGCGLFPFSDDVSLAAIASIIRAVDLNSLKYVFSCYKVVFFYSNGSQFIMYNFFYYDYPKVSFSNIQMPIFHSK